MMVGADTVGAENQETPGEHKTEHHPHSLITDLVNNRGFKVPLANLRSIPEIQ